MSTTTNRPHPRTDLASLLASADDIADTLAAGASEAESLRRLGPSAAAALRSTDLFRIWWPSEVGGIDATVSEGIEVIEKVAEIDTSAAWNLAVCTLGSGLAAAYLDDDAFAEIFAEDLPLIAGQTAPVGRAIPVDGGLEVSGNWFFGSGIHLASWVKAGVLIEHDDGPPEPAIVIVPADAVTIKEGSWEVAGLAGSGSNDYSMDAVHVPTGFWYNFPVATPKRGGRSFQLPIPGQLVILHAGFALGVARRCLDEVTELAKTKIRQFDSRSISNRPTFRYDLAEKSAAVSAARLYTYDAADRLNDAAGTPLVVDAMREMRAAARYANDIALDVATWSYRHGGGAALHLSHPLQRLLRDILAATQHIFIDDAAYTDYGGALLGIDDRRAK
jgi:alkylation response protein AidB-like acyl-CoA dehydrogenase